MAVGANSVTHWFGLLREGDEVAAQRLWERYFPLLVNLARGRLTGGVRVSNAPEDVALSAFASFCHHAERGRFPNLAGRDELWRLLVTLTVRKVCRAVRDERRTKRGGDYKLAEINFDEMVGDEPTPVFAAQVADEFRRLVQLLGNEELTRIVVKKMEGYSTAEIAAWLECAPRTVERKLSLIRRVWESELSRDSSLDSD